MARFYPPGRAAPHSMYDGNYRAFGDWWSAAMGSFSIWHWLIVLAVVVMTFGTARFMRVDKEWLRSQLDKDVGRVPVYSAEATNGREAEFIRDRLPKQFPALLALIVALVLCAVIWWLTR